MKLTDTHTQLIVLNKAAQRSTMLALPLPPKLKGCAANKVVIPLIQKGLLEEIDADTRTGETIWRETRAGQGVTLAITEAGLAAIGIGPESVKKSRPAASQTPANTLRKANTAATGRQERQTGENRRAGQESRTDGARWRDRANAARGHETGDHDRHAPAQERRDHRRDYRGHRLAAAYDSRRLRRRAQEKARAQHRLRER